MEPTRELFEKVYIKDALDLPKEEGKYECHIKDGEGYNDRQLRDFSNDYHPQYGLNFWLNNIDWYLQPVEQLQKQLYRGYCDTCKNSDKYSNGNRCIYDCNDNFSGYEPIEQEQPESLHICNSCGKSNNCKVIDSELISCPNWQPPQSEIKTAIVSKSTLLEAIYLLALKQPDSCPKWIEGIGDCNKPECEFCRIQRCIDNLEGNTNIEHPIVTEVKSAEECLSKDDIETVAAILTQEGKFNMANDLLQKYDNLIARLASQFKQIELPTKLDT